MNDADLTSTLKTMPRLLIVRTDKSTDALFGEMSLSGEHVAVTMERTAVAIAPGVYQARKRDSAHFGMRVVGIDVPNRTNIEIHPANYPSQLMGCVAVGDRRDSDALDNSRDAFERMMGAVPESFEVEIREAA